MTKFDFKSLKKEIHEVIEEGVSEVMDYAEERLILRTPEDTYELNENWEKLPIKKEGSLVTGEIENLTPHGIYVEFGQTTTGKKFNYYKAGGRRKGGSPFHTGVGARMVTKTADEDQQDMFDILANKVKKSGI